MWERVDGAYRVEKMKRLLVAATAIEFSCGCHEACKIFLPKSSGVFSGVGRRAAAAAAALFLLEPAFFALKADLSACKGIVGAGFSLS